MKGAFESTLARLKTFAWKFSEPYRKASSYERWKWFTLACVSSAACVGAEYVFYKYWAIGIDSQVFRCIDARVYLISKTDRRPVRDHIFAIRAANAAPVIPDGERMAKYIRGMPGDLVEITPDFQILVNGRKVGEGLHHLQSSGPEVVKKFIGKRVLKDDEYWVMGTMPKSFDSRYYGPVHFRQIEGRVYAAF